MLVSKGCYLERVQILIGTMPKPQSIASLFKRREAAAVVLAEKQRTSKTMGAIMFHQVFKIIILFSHG
jgi:hypothetical protein